MKISRKQIKLLLFLAAALLIVAISVHNCLQGAVTWSSDPYAATIDSYLDVQEGQEIQVNFQIAGDNFQGVFIQLKEEIKTFETEKLQFYLFDRTSHTCVASYTMELKNVLSQFTIFASLPYENQAGAEVSLVIVGEDIHITPCLALSSQPLQSSKLYLDNLRQKGSYLTFSGVYAARQAIDYQDLMKGLAYLLLLLLVYIWPGMMTRAERSAAKPPKTQHAALAQKQSAAAQSTSQRRKLLILLVGAVLLGVTAWFVYKDNVQELMQQKHTVKILKKSEDLTITLDSEHTLLEQTFPVEERYLSALTFTMKAVDVEPEARLHLTVTDAETQVRYHDAWLPISKLSSNAKKQKILLDTQLTGKKACELLISWELVDAGTTSIVFSAGLLTDTGSCAVNGQYRNTAPALSVTYEDYDYLKPVYKIWLILLFIFFLYCYVMFVVLGKSLSSVFIPTALCAGILYMLVIPLYSVPDEYTHMDTAYILSNRILGIGAIDELYGYEYRRSSDIEPYELLTYKTEASDYRRLYLELTQRTEDTELEMVSMRSSLANANAFCYAPGAIGITLGRLLGLGTLPMYLLGRFFSLLAFVLLCALALHKLPDYREIFAFFMTLPIVLQQAASYSYDSVLNGMAFVFIAYCLYEAWEAERFRTIDGLVLLFTCMQLASVKGGVYLPLCMLVLIIPIERRYKLSRALGCAVMMGIPIGFAFLQDNIARLLSRFFTSMAGRVNPHTGSELYSFGYLLQHPMKGVKLYLNTLFTSGSRFIYEIFGGKMGSLSNLQLPWFYILVFMLLLLVLMCKERKNRLCGRGSRLLMWMLTAMSFCLIALAMLLADTKVGNKTISGLQGRYFIPFALLPVIAVTRRIAYHYNGSSDTGNVQFAYYVVQIIFMLNVLMIAL